jgi:wyosine [tRNA(Phe)-imidazoG37] synthetase (radical SAM superfamily)
VLTNGSLLWSRSVRQELAEADMVLPSLDAGDEALFHYVNRPHPDLDFDQVVQGLVDFRREFRRPIWLEVFLLGGVTDVPPEAGRLAALARKIGADRVQLNSVARPPCESFAFPVPRPRLEALAPLFGERAEVIVSRDTRLPEGAVGDPGEQELLDLLRRRPCTLAEVCQGLGVNPAETAKALERLLAAGHVREQTEGPRRFFVVRPEAAIDGPSRPL